MEVSTIGRYEILSELAHGGMGVIFLAHDPFMQRPVIVKVLTYQFVHEEFHRDFFQQEAKIIEGLSILVESFSKSKLSQSQSKV